MGVRVRLFTWNQNRRGLWRTEPDRDGSGEGFEHSCGEVVTPAGSIADQVLKFWMDLMSVLVETRIPDVFEIFPV